MHDRLFDGEALTANEGIASSDSTYRLLMQGDGNLVEYGPRGPLWASNTGGHPNAVAILQGDGNLVVYGGGRPLFASHTAGQPGDVLLMQRDSNIVIYSGGRAVFATGS